MTATLTAPSRSERIIPRAERFTRLDRKKTVVLFAGSGGSCQGIEEAYCAGGLDQPIDLAVNHDPDAIACHAANHPLTEHLECDVFEVDPEIVEGPIGLLWASPDCTDFSKAKGGRPIRTVKRRSLAWVVIHWAFVKRPDVITLENVEEFEQWGPLDDEGMPVRDGSTFKIWVNCLRYLGYQVEWRCLRACDYGTPTTRNRLYVVARCDGKPIVWPEPTHGDLSDGRNAAARMVRKNSATDVERNGPSPIGSGAHRQRRKCGRSRGNGIEGASRAARSGLRSGVGSVQRPQKLKPYVPAAACIDFDRPMCSIFATPAEAKAWAETHGVHAPKRPLAENTCERMAKGIVRHVIDAGRPFIVRMGHYSHSTGEGRHFRGQAIDQPLSTVTAGFHDKALVDAQMVRASYLARTCNTNGNGDYTNAADEPLRTVTTCHDQQLVSAWLVKHHSGVVGQGLDKPCPTVKGTDSNGLAACLLSHMYTSHTAGGQGDLRKPKKTVLAGANHASLVSALLAPYYGSGSGRTGRDVREPIPTIPATDRHQLITTALERGGTDELPAGFWRVWRFLIEHIGPDAPPPIVVLDGEVWLITDIAMRMLTPRELARCQGFRDDYIIDRGADGRRLSSRTQVRLIGNSVCRQVARALVRVNVVDQDVMWRAAA